MKHGHSDSHALQSRLDRDCARPTDRVQLLQLRCCGSDLLRGGFALARPVTGIQAARLATKLHAILDRGLRRDFFDLYVMLQHHQLGIVAVLAAIHAVYQ